MSSKVTIEFHGPQASGKTVLSNFIEDALKKHGATVTRPSMVPTKLSGDRPDMLHVEISDELKQKRVNLSGVELAVVLRAGLQLEADAMRGQGRLHAAARLEAAIEDLSGAQFTRLARLLTDL